MYCSRPAAFVALHECYLLTSVKTHVHTHTHGTGLVRCCSGNDPQPTNPIGNDGSVTLSQIQLHLASEVCLCVCWCCAGHEQEKKKRIRVLFLFIFTSCCLDVWCRIRKLHTVVHQSALASLNTLGLATVEVICGVI